MDLLWSLGLFVGVLFALFFMGGAKAEHLVQHLTRFISRLIVTVIRVAVNLISYGFTAGARNLRLDGLVRVKDDRHRDFHKPTEKRW